jgi:hypothetical protein
MGKITTHLHVVPRLRTSGIISISAFMPYTETTLLSFFYLLLTKLQILLVMNFDYHFRARTQRMDENRVLRQIFVSRKEDEPGGYTGSIRN